MPTRAKYGLGQKGDPLFRIKFNHKVIPRVISLVQEKKKIVRNIKSFVKSSGQKVLRLSRQLELNKTEEGGEKW